MKLISCLFTIATVTSFQLVHAQVPRWNWAKGPANDKASAGYDVATDAARNLYVTGMYFDTLDFGGVTILPHNAQGKPNNIFVVKYDPLGKPIWAVTGGGQSLNTQLFQIITDKKCNVYICGLSIDSGFFGNVIIPPHYYFIAKYDSSGAFSWAKKVGAIVASISASGFDEIYVTGNYYINAFFDSASLQNNGAIDPYLAKYSSLTGNLIWAKDLGGPGIGFSIVSDKWGNNFIEGTFPDTTVLESIKLMKSQPAGCTDCSVFLAKYDSSGHVQWAKNFGDNNATDNTMGIAADDLGNCVTVGLFKNTLQFGSFTVNSQIASPRSNLYITKYDSSGNVLWAKYGGMTPNGKFSDIASDKMGNTFIAGSVYEFDATFGSTTLGTAASTTNMFVVKYDSSGSVSWATKASSKTPSCRASGLSVDDLGHAYIAGYSNRNSQFGDLTINTNELGSKLFTARLSSPTGLPQPGFQRGNVVIFPNPTSGNLTIEFKAGNYNQLKVFDQIGRLVYFAPIDPGRESISFKLNAANGLYYVQLSGKAQPAITKVLLQR